jgi:Flp pilus assembly protein TadD
LLERIGRGSEARVLLEQLLGKRPNDVALHVHLAGLCSRLGDTSRAIVLLQQALQIEPGNAEASSLLRQLQSGR